MLVMMLFYPTQFQILKSLRKYYNVLSVLSLTNGQSFSCLRGEASCPLECVVQNALRNNMTVAHLYKTDNEDMNALHTAERFHSLVASIGKVLSLAILHYLIL